MVNKIRANQIRLYYSSSRLLHQLREHSLYRLFFFDPNHIWLASYPRSGNTWLRRMLHELLLDEPSDLQKIRFSIPDIHNKWDIFNIKQAPTNFVKTHFPYTNYCKKVIYLIRNPLDVIYSYWNLEKKANQSVLSLDQIIERETTFGGLYGRWDKHIISYLNSELSPQKILFIHYEKLISDPLDTLEVILKFCEIYYPKHKLEKVVASSIDIFLNEKQKIGKSYEQKKQTIFDIQIDKGLKQLNNEQIKIILNSPIGTAAVALGYFNDLIDYSHNR